MLCKTSLFRGCTFCCQLLYNDAVMCQTKTYCEFLFLNIDELCVVVVFYSGISCCTLHRLLLEKSKMKRAMHLHIHVVQ